MTSQILGVTFIDDEVAIVTDAAAPLHQTLEAFRRRRWACTSTHRFTISCCISGCTFSLAEHSLALRIPSIVFYLLSGLWLLSRAAEEIGGPSGARALLWLGALWPFGFHFGRLARAWYSFCFLIVAAMTLAYLHLLRRPSPARWSLLLLCATALALHELLRLGHVGMPGIRLHLAALGETVFVAALQVTWLSLVGYLLALIYVPLWRVFLVELRTGTHFIHSPAATALLGAFSLYSSFVSESVSPWIWALGIPACLCIAIILCLAL